MAKLFKDKERDVEMVHNNSSVISITGNEKTGNTNETKHLKDTYNLLEKCSNFTQKTSAFPTPLENNQRASLNAPQTSFERRTTLNQRVKLWIAPSDTPANAKIFGGRRAVQEEQLRSKNAGWIIHPYSRMR